MSEAQGKAMARLRAGASRHSAPPGLREDVLARIAGVPFVRARPRPSAMDIARLAWSGLLGGGALAAIVLVAGFFLGAWRLAPPGFTGELAARGAGLGQELVLAHARAFATGHLEDVLSSDRHTVKPWLAERTDMVPPVRDFADQGFPLLGGRLDYAGDRAIPVLVYGRRKHVIDVFVLREPVSPQSLEVRGVHVEAGVAGDLPLAAVSDLDPAELRELLSLISSVAKGKERVASG